MNIFRYMQFSEMFVNDFLMQKIRNIERVNGELYLKFTHIVLSMNRKKEIRTIVLEFYYNEQMQASIEIPTVNLQSTEQVMINENLLQYPLSNINLVINNNQ